VISTPSPSPGSNGSTSRATVSIRSLLAVLVAAMALPLLGTGAYLGWRAYGSDRARAQERLLGTADVVAYSVHQFIGDSERLLQGFASDPRVAALDPADCDDVLGSVRSVLAGVYTNLASWRVDGTPVCSTLPPPPEGLDMEQAPGFREALAADRLTITPVQRGRRSGRLSTTFTYPIQDSTGARTGMATLSVDLVRFQEILRAMRLPEGTVVSVTQPDGTVVARSRDAEKWVGSVLPRPDERMDQDPDVVARGVSRAASAEGLDFSWGFVRVPNTDWLVFAGLPSQDVFGSVWALRFRLALLGILTAAGATLLGVMVYRRVASPLQALVAAIADDPGGRESPLPTDGPREIAWVAERLNQAWAARSRAEAEQARATDRIRSLVENAATGIAVSTAGGRFLEVNQAMVELLGYDSREELLATPVDAVYLSPEARRRHLEAHGGMETFRGIPVTWQRRDGGILHVRLTGRRLNFEGGEAVWETFVEDVTEVTRLQAQYAQSQKMEALGRLAGGVAHDFNNILTVVRGQADLLRTDAGLDADRRTQAEEILQAADRGAALNRQLLAFGRRSPAEKGALDLNEVVAGFELVMRRAAGDEVPMEFQLDAEMGWVHADRSQLEQILMNLVVNARDAMPGGGRIRLATSNAAVSATEAAHHTGAQEGEHVVLAVTDSGTGIPPEILPHIFEPFYSTKPSPRGTGLGLATVYGIVADSGGHVRVRSEPGKGTTFEIFLPRHAYGPVEPRVSEDVADARRGIGVILLVEDEAGVRRLARRILERAGYQVLSASDGPEALALAAGRNGSFDLLLSDVIMPGMRGPQVAEALAAGGRVGRAVFISGNPEGLSDTGPRGISEWAFLPKPFGADELLRVVRRVLGR
jgi:PAS domain S-box-containing protein